MRMDMLIPMVYLLPGRRVECWEAAVEAHQSWPLMLGATDAGRRLRVRPCFSPLRAKRKKHPEPGTPDGGKTGTKTRPHAAPDAWTPPRTLPLRRRWAAGRFSESSSFVASSSSASGISARCTLLI